MSSPAFAADGVAPVDAAECAAMQAHHVLNTGAPVACDRLAVVTFGYVDFAGGEHGDGRIVVMDAVAPRVLRIFAALHARHFPIAKAEPLEAYEGNDETSMMANNTSGFNDRPVSGTTRLSLHAYGAAIDLNPVQNPFVERGAELGAVFLVHPAEGAGYLNRLQHRPGKADRAGMAEEVVAIFAENGFTQWGGYWDDPLDFQHFDIGRPLAEELAKLTPQQARIRFEQAVACRVDICAEKAVVTEHTISH